MGMWGFGPTQSDDAANVIDRVRAILEEAWEELRNGKNVRAREAAEIVSALGKSGIDVVPEDAEDLATIPRISASVVEALTTQWPRERPPFGPERAVERRLRENGASYEVWSTAVAYGDDHEAMWRAQTEPDQLIAIARAYGIDVDTIRRGIAKIALPLASGPMYAERPFRSIAEVLATVERGRRANGKLIKAMSTTLREYNMQMHHVLLESLGTGKKLEHDPRMSLLSLSVDLGDAEGNSVRPVRSLVEQIPDLTSQLRSYLDPFFAKLVP